MKKLPPSGQNNEQFRDCCIWDAAMSLATEQTVHLITKDSAFYQGRSTSNVLASALAQELADVKRDVHIYPSLQSFLIKMNKSVGIDKAHIGPEIVEAVMSSARDIAARTEFGSTEIFELGEVHGPVISGYATPQSSLLAISFEISFDLRPVFARQDGEEYKNAKLDMKGVCACDPKSKKIFDVEVREWHKQLGQRVIGFVHPAFLERQYSPLGMRVI
jgi:hypothetical protein